MQNHYNKPALTIDEQIDLLESRGLSIPNRNKARHYLNFINYYRLSGYTISFEQVVDGKRNHKFRKGAANRLFEFLNNHKFIRSERMGFTSNWQHDVFWGLNNA